jgi:hypothetical protein
MCPRNGFSLRHRLPEFPCSSCRVGLHAAEHARVMGRNVPLESSAYVRARMAGGPRGSCPPYLPSSFLAGQGPSPTAWGTPCPTAWGHLGPCPTA